MRWYNFFFPGASLAARVFDSLAGFYTSPSPDVQWQTVILACLQMWKIQVYGGSGKVGMDSVMGRQFFLEEGDGKGLAGTEHHLEAMVVSMAVCKTAGASRLWIWLRCAQSLPLLGSSGPPLQCLAQRVCMVWLQAAPDGFVLCSCVLCAGRPPGKCLHVCGVALPEL